MRNTTICVLMLLSLAAQASAQTPTNLLGAAPPPLAVADAPVTLADARSFDAPLVSEIADAEIVDARRAMANAVSAEKFLDGVATVFAVAILLAIAF